MKWLKAFQIFEIADSGGKPIKYNPTELEQNLEQIRFKSCLPSMPYSYGWSNPIPTPIPNDDAPLVHGANGCMLFCMQTEEKILPQTIVNQELAKRVAEIEAQEERKLGARARKSLKEDITAMLLPQAFGAIKRVYAYIDTQHNWLVLATTQKKHLEWFFDLIRKTCQWQLTPIQVDNLSHTLTQWVSECAVDGNLHLEQSAMLFDPNHIGRSVRCTQHDLASSDVQTLIENGFSIKQLALNWLEHMSFRINDQFQISQLKIHDELIEVAKSQYAETAEQQFDADFVLMTEQLRHLIQLLLTITGHGDEKANGHGHENNSASLNSSSENQTYAIASSGNNVQSETEDSDADADAETQAAADNEVEAPF